MHILKTYSRSDGATAARAWTVGSHYENISVRAEGFNQKIYAFCGVTVVVGNEDEGAHVLGKVKFELVP